MNIFLSGFLLGLLGSFHCAGMCGPIALALPLQQASRNKIITGRLLYNFGRIITYTIIGFFAGLIGYAISIKGFQSDMSIITGVLILVALLITAGSRFSNDLGSSIAKLTSPLKNQFRTLFGKSSYVSMFLIGMLNGLLPCGFVYIALAAAATTGDYTGGMAYMFLFGLGTLPMMFSIAVLRNFFNLKFQKLFNKAIPVITIAVAVLLIYRGTIMKDEGSCCKETRHISSVSKD